MAEDTGYSKETPKGHYNTRIKVPESVIKEIRELGMAASIKKAKSAGVSKEFKEGVRRFYPAAIDDIKESNKTAAKARDPKPRGGDSVSTSSSSEEDDSKLTQHTTKGGGLGFGGDTPGKSSSKGSPGKRGGARSIRNLEGAAKRRISADPSLSRAERQERGKETLSKMGKSLKEITGEKFDSNRFAGGKKPSKEGESKEEFEKRLRELAQQHRRR